MVIEDHQCREFWHGRWKKRGPYIGRSPKFNTCVIVRYPTFDKGQHMSCVVCSGGANGKSVLQNFVNHCLGDYVCTVQSNLLTTKRLECGRANSELVSMRNIRNQVPYFPEGRHPLSWHSFTACDGRSLLVYVRLVSGKRGHRRPPVLLPGKRVWWEQTETTLLHLERRYVLYYPPFCCRYTEKLCKSKLPCHRQFVEEWVSFSG